MKTLLTLGLALFTTAAFAGHDLPNNDQPLPNHDEREQILAGSLLEARAQPAIQKFADKLMSGYIETVEVIRNDEGNTVRIYGFAIAGDIALGNIALEVNREHLMRPDCNPEIAGDCLRVTTKLIQNPSVPAARAPRNLALLASALTSSQTRQARLNFARLAPGGVDLVVIQNLEDLDNITITGTIIREGDIACGDVTLKIAHSSMEIVAPVGGGFSRRDRYDSEVTTNKVCR